MNGKPINQEIYATIVTSKPRVPLSKIEYKKFLIKLLRTHSLEQIAEKTSLSVDFLIERLQ